MSIFLSGSGRRTSRTAVFLAALLLLALCVATASAAVWTDQPDYMPGSIVTISGDNSDGAGYLPGETVLVEVSGPNGYAASCTAVAAADGAWSCQVTLWADETAVGDYSYTAAGRSSGTLESGAFTDGVADAHSCAITEAGGAKCWGYNGAGGLGDGTTSQRTTPVDVSGLGSGVALISGGGAHTCAVTVTGAALCWGYNSFGQLGDGTYTQRTSPVGVSGLGNGVAQISAGAIHSCALTQTGAALCWGYNSFGTVGDGTTMPYRPTPVGVSGLGSGVAQISSGIYHTCALTDNGAVKCWGDNSYGQLGDGTTTLRKSPVGVSGLGSGVAQISAGSWHTCAVTETGAALCWGDNRYGKLGDGSTVSQLTPVSVIGLGSGVTQISAGETYTCALTQGGAVWCWGNNSGGQLGDGTGSNRLTAAGVSGLGSGVVQISANYGHTCALTLAGAVLCWGWNGYGQLGDGTTTNRLTPVGVSGLGSGVMALFDQLAADSTAPTLTITGATADGSPMPGSLAGGYVLMTGGNAAANHQIAFAAGTEASEPLEAAYFGLKLVSSTVSAADLHAYYEARGVPEPYLSYLKAAADGTNPFVYIKGDGTTTAVALADAAQYDLASTDSPMLVPDDYPPGTYIVQGMIEDLAENETAVTLILVVMRSTCPGSDACMAVVPPDELLLCGEERTVTFALNGVSGLYGYQFDVAYDGTVVTPTPSFVDGFFTVPTEAESHSASCASDSCTFFATKLNPSAPVSGSGPVAQLALDPLGGGGGGAFDMTVSNLLLTTLDGEVIPSDLPAETLRVTACGQAALSGTINLQGRVKPFSSPVYHDPALVTLVGPGAPYGTYTAAIDPATGNYAFSAVNVDPAGTAYEIRAAYDLYISNRKTITAVPGSNAQAATRLLGGDANLSANQLVDILDLACIGGDFGKTSDYGCEAHGSSDINDDGKVNIQDLAIAGGNYARLSYLPW